MTSDKRRFIVIDDNKLDSFIAEKIILNSGIGDKINLFFDAREALDFIRQDEYPDTGCRIIIIVDIQMPLMNGFEFVEAFETLPEETQNNYDIFVLSSSTNESDRHRVLNYKSVKDLLNKPLSVTKLSSVIQAL